MEHGATTTTGWLSAYVNCCCRCCLPGLYRQTVSYSISLMMILLAAVPLALLGLVSCASGGMDCLRNRDCATKHEHLCNMQSGLWTKNYVLSSHNGSYNGECGFLTGIDSHLKYCISKSFWTHVPAASCLMFIERKSPREVFSTR